MADAIGVEEIDEVDAFKKMQRNFDTARANSPKSRKAREQKMRNSVDARKLRERTVTVQLNSRVPPDIKDRIVFAAKQQGLTIQEWIIEMALKMTPELEPGDGAE